MRTPQGNGGTAAGAVMQLPHDTHHALLFPGQGAAFLFAAPASHIIVELTTHKDNRMMTDFFYTYRAYMTPHELLRLLIARFEWALHRAASPDNEPGRAIVRVRTYVVIKYWLINFFAMDFLPNRELRQEFTSWLNAISHEKEPPLRSAEMNIVKSLKQTVRNLKAAYEKTGIGGLLMADGGATPRIPESNSFPGSLHEVGTADAQVSLELGDESVDEPLASPTSSIRRKPTTATATAKTPTHSASADGRFGQGSLQAPPPLPTSHGALSRAVLSTFSRLSRFKRHINSRASTNPFFKENIDGLDYDTNNCHDLLFTRGGVESFLDYFDLRTPRLTSAGGRESADEGQDRVSDAATTVREEDGTPSLSSNQTRSTPASSFDLGNRSQSDRDSRGTTYGLGITEERDEGGLSGFHDAELGLALLTELAEAPAATPAKGVAELISSERGADALHHFQSDQTLRSASRAQRQPASMRFDSSPKRLGNTASPSRSQHPFQASDNIVQIDDIDLSSDEDEGMVRRALRRLPGARDLRTTQNVTELEANGRPSFDSISSLGQVHESSQRSLASYYGTFASAANPDAHAVGAGHAYETTTMTSEMLDPDEALRGLEIVKGFRLEHLEDSDDEESGDVEAALRRLEGVIDEDKMRERARRVERMWQRSRDRQATEKAKSSSSLATQREEEDVQDAESELEVERPKSPEDAEAELAEVATPVPQEKEREHASVKVTGSFATTRAQESSSSGGANPKTAAASAAVSRLPRSMWAPPPMHRSFLLDYHSELIAQQFSLIEVELFRAISWQELVSDQWKIKHHAGEVRDWEVFYQERARHRVEARGRTRAARSSATSAPAEAIESSVEAITARFKLTCNWVASEVLLTSTVDMRAAVVRKLIRVAWKCYHQSNFATLTQIILGLQSPWVERLRKTWARVGSLELRMLRDLKAFINPTGDFMHLRNAMHKMLIQGRMEDMIISSGPPQAQGNGSVNENRVALNDGCIPFFGLFLADLAQQEALPTFVEPSSLDVEADTSAGHLKAFVEPPASPDAESASSSMTGGRLKTFLEPAATDDDADWIPISSTEPSPWINLYKYRILAMTVKSVLALQDRLDAYNFQVDRGVYVKALKLRCLEADHLRIISQLAEP